jgi:hypothetical protein
LLHGFLGLGSSYPISEIELPKSNSTHNANPVTKRNNDISGNVVRRRARRPNVSMVQIAGAANFYRRQLREPRAVGSLTSQFRAPNPSDAAKADTTLNPDSCGTFRDTSRRI